LGWSSHSEGGDLPIHVPLEASLFGASDGAIDKPHGVRQICGMLSFVAHEHPVGYKVSKRDILSYLLTSCASV